MSNLVHQFTAAIWGFAFLSGVLTFAAKGWLGRRLDALEHPARFDRPGIYLALVGPGLIAGLWLVSSLMHLGATGSLSEACCQVFGYGAGSWQQWVFAVGALVVAGIQLHSLSQTWQFSHSSHRPSDRSDVVERVRGICQEHPRLSRLSERIRVVDCEAHVCATVGIFRPRIEIAASLVDRLDDAALESALLHEAAHVRLHDPNAGFALSVAQILNPFSSVLAPEASAWRFAREVECDRRAVDWGAQPVSVADALVTAARALSDSAAGACARLCGARTDALSARVKLLIHEALPEQQREAETVLPWVGIVVLAAGIFGPHLVDGWLISIHCFLEEILHGCFTATL